MEEQPAPGRIRPPDVRSIDASRWSPLTLIEALFSVIVAILRSAVSAFLLLFSVFLSSAVVLALVAVIAVSLTGVVTVRLARRRAAKRSGS